MTFPTHLRNSALDKRLLMSYTITMAKPVKIRSVHPGQILREYCESYGYTGLGLSKRLGLTPKTVSYILNGKGLKFEEATK